MNDEVSLLMLWMDLHMSQQSDLKSLIRKTYNNSMIQHPNCLRTGSAWGTESGALNR